MAFAADVHQPAKLEVGVLLGRGQAFMAEELLNNPEINEVDYFFVISRKISFLHPSKKADKDSIEQGFTRRSISGESAENSWMRSKAVPSQ